MNPFYIQYVAFRYGEWRTEYETKYRQGVLIPQPGYVVTLPPYNRDYEVTKVRFNIPGETVVIEVSLLPEKE